MFANLFQIMDEHIYSLLESDGKLKRHILPVVKVIITVSYFKLFYYFENHMNLYTQSRSVKQNFSPTHDECHRYMIKNHWLADKTRTRMKPGIYHANAHDVFS